jgi:trk system potassium uptake protein TrkH
MLLFMGGCAGSTAGAMRVIRVLLFGKQAAHELFRTMHPNGVTKLRLNGSVVTNASVSAFMGLY